MGAAQAIVAQLSGDSTVSGLVGVRIRPLQADQADAFPRVTYSAPLDSRPRNYKGPSGLTKATVTIAAIASTYAGAVALDGAIRNALDNGSGTWGGAVVRGCFHNEGSTSDSRESAGDTAPDKPAYIRESTYTLWVSE